MKKLGATIYSSLNIKQELVKRLGGAWGKSLKYTGAWKHRSISVERKLSVSAVLVTTEIGSYVNSAWQNKNRRRSLDGFQARCLRRILNIHHSYTPRVPDKNHQNMWIGKHGRSSDADVLRNLTLQPGSVRPTTAAIARKRGWRPRR
eukprot:9469500-Pyramimonas_sp.AAC.1